MIELLVVLIMLGIVLLMSIPRLSMLFSSSEPTRYCNNLRSLRTELEVMKANDLIHRCYPSSVSSLHLIDPYTGHPIDILTSTLSQVYRHCPLPATTDTIYYCPVVVDGCAYAYKIGIARSVEADIYTGCLIGVDRR